MKTDSLRLGLKRLARAAKFAHLHTINALVGLRGSRSYVRSATPGERDLTGARNVAIFVHFEKKGVVHPYVIAHLEGLEKAGYTIVFVTNSPKFPEAQKAKVLPHCALVLHRSNRGYDFGSYRDAILHLGPLDELDSLIVCNDSVYGPIQDLRTVLERCDPKKADIWGLTDSWDKRFHLQSYFLLFHKTALANPDFQKRWRKFVHIDDKEWVVLKHEVGLTTDMITAGLRCRAVWRYSDLIDAFVDDLEKRGDLLTSEKLQPYHRTALANMLNYAQSGSPMNINHFFWDRLLLDGFPYLKRDLLSANPMKLPQTYRWRSLLRRVSDYDPELIVGHLETSLRNRSI